MKKNLLLLPALIFSAVFLMRFVIPDETGQPTKPSKASKFKITRDVEPIIKKSCYGCHNQDSKNQKARDKLSFDVMENLPKAKLYASLNKIHEKVSKGEMPPKKFLARFPEAGLNQQEADKILAWSDKESSRIMKNKD